MNYLKSYLKHCITIIFTGFLILGCEPDSAQPARHSGKPAKAKLVRTITLTPQRKSIERRFNALVIAPNAIHINNQVAGTILQIPYIAGDKVKKGDLLIQLDDSIAKAELKKAQASLDRASQNLIRIKKLIPQHLASAEELTTASTDLQLAKAGITLKSIQLKHTSIHAPFTGVISELFYLPGDSLSINKQVLTLVDNNFLKILSAIPESFIANIFTNQEVTINIPALTLKLSGKISSIYPTVDSSTQQITIIVDLNSSYKKLYPGQFAEVLIEHKTNKQLMLPANAIQYDAKGSWVYKVDTKNTTLQTYITTGLNINSDIEVLSGLNNNDIIVTHGFVGLRPGKKVTTKRSKNNMNKVK